MLPIQSEEEKLNRLRKLVGAITEDQLKHVEYYVGESIGICIPSTGFCEYAVKWQHTHPSYSFVVCFTENVITTKTEYIITPYHYLACVMEPGFPHEEERKDTFTRYIALFIDKDYFEKCYQLYETEVPAFTGITSFYVPNEIMQPINQFIKEAEGTLPGKDNIINSLTELITHQFIRSLQGITSDSIITGNHATMYHIIDYMYQNFDKKLEVAELAKMAGLSVTYFIRIFKKETHYSPITFLEKIRISNAKNLLRHSNENISEIALMCGYNNCSHFSSRFSKEVGISPSAYKKNYQIS